MQGINGMGLSAQAGQVGVSQVSDSVTKSLQKQINELKKQLNELSTDTSITMEEKRNRQQALQQQITDLQNQLHQHQTEQRKEQLKEKTESAKTSEQAGMEVVISADSAVKNAKVQESTAARMERRASVLKSEIELDAGRGSGAVSSKLQELSKAEQASKDAKATQMQLLGDANQDVRGAVEASRDPEKAEEKAKEEKAEKEETLESREEVQGEVSALMYGSDGKPVMEEKESRLWGRA